MTLDSDQVLNTDPLLGGTAEPVALISGRLISLRFVKDALHRHALAWVSIAVLGLLCGAAYHFVVPIKYAAYTTVYLADNPGAGATSTSSNDLALLQTQAVAQRAIKILDEPKLSPFKLLGATPGIIVSANVMTVTIDGPTTHEAIRRANAVTQAFLSFRAQQYGAQTDTINAGLNAEISGLEASVNTLTSEINGTGPIPNGDTLTDLAGQRAQDSANIISLQQTVQQNELGELSVAKGSQVITPGTVVPSRKIKAFVLDGASGLVVGLGLGLGLVLLQAILSDRLRRREDIAAVIGAPVDLSVDRIQHPRVATNFRLRRLAKKPPLPIHAIVRYFRNQLPTVGSGPTLLVVAVDDVQVPALAIATLAGRLASEGKTVVLADLTSEKVLARMYKVSHSNPISIRIGPGQHVTLVVPTSQLRLETDGSDDPIATRWTDADVVLALATVDPAVGAWHLLRWAGRATAVVTSGRSTVQQINGTAELLRAASVGLTSVILVGCDKRDDSVGLSESGESPMLQSVGSLPTPTPPDWR